MIFLIFIQSAIFPWGERAFDRLLYEIIDLTEGREFNGRLERSLLFFRHLVSAGEGAERALGLSMARRPGRRRGAYNTTSKKPRAGDQDDQHHRGNQDALSLAFYVSQLLGSLDG
jgi:hypothetical protein